MVECPICSHQVLEKDINAHIDSACNDFLAPPQGSSQRIALFSSFFSTPSARHDSKQAASTDGTSVQIPQQIEPVDEKPSPRLPAKRPSNDASSAVSGESSPSPRLSKKPRQTPLQKVAPLADRMRPRSLDQVCGQELVGPDGILRELIEQDRVPSMILWGGSGTGKTTIARIIATTVGARFFEINSANSGVGEVKKIFAEAKAELQMVGRKTIIFCDEIHRFSKSQQDVFLAPVEAGWITLIGATTENPSFKIVNALLSRCRTFTLSKLTERDIVIILERALVFESNSSPLLDLDMLSYLAAFADGDARTALNLLEMATELSKRSNITVEKIKQSLTQTLVYDRAGDQHYDTISAFHKSIRGSDADAALYYLARMLQSGEDPLFIGRRLIVVASEDIGLADNTMLPLAIAAYTAVEKIGMPEARIPLAHATVALCIAPKSTRAYRALNKAYSALLEPGIAGLPIPLHVRNAPTKLMKSLGYGKEYKYNPDYVEGKVKQEYLPEKLQGRRFLDDGNLGLKKDPDLEDDVKSRALEETTSEFHVDDDDHIGTLLPEVDD